MNEQYLAFVEMGKRLATQRNLEWDLQPDLTGKLNTKTTWEVMSLSGRPPPPRRPLTDLGSDAAALKALNREREQNELPPLSKTALSLSWQNLLKAALVDQLFVQKNSPTYALDSVVRALRVVATCSPGVEPWELTREHIECAYRVALASQSSGLLANVVVGVSRSLIDRLHLSNQCPVAPASNARNVASKLKPQRKKDTLRHLASRKDEEKLPSNAAFWELARIVFTEKPTSFLDELRFAQVRILMMCGLRIGELCTLPVNCLTQKTYVDHKGRLADISGGISRSFALHYFPEKQSQSDRDGSLLTADMQHVAAQFEIPLGETIDRVAQLTTPLRNRLKAQLLTNRILTDFEPDQLVPVTELFPYLSGNPHVYEDPHFPELAERYKQEFDISVLHEIQERQAMLRKTGADLRNHVRVYFTRLKASNAVQLCFRDLKGRVMYQGDYRSGCFHIAELEQFIRSTMPTKLSDFEGFRTSEKDIKTADLLFLVPKRSLAEERNGGICDLTRYSFVGRVTSEDLIIYLSSDQKRNISLYQKYSKTDEEKNYSINSHAFRHLQNAELFRLGIADTIITKRFGRRSVAQSYEYDHRSLAEELDSIEVPETAKDTLGEKAQQALKLIASGKVKGRIVDEFLSIQKADGDDAAFKFLATEADGFHTTPYGFCINSFTVDPCPKHLECYNGCLHFSSTPLHHHRKNLEKLKDQFQVAIQTIEALPVKSLGRDNQLVHARTRLSNLERVLSTPPGTKSFPDGKDFSEKVENSRRTPLDE